MAENQRIYQGDNIMDTEKVVDKIMNIVEDAITEKIRCASCKEYKLPSEFYVDRSRKNGRKSKCKECCDNGRRYKKTVNDFVGQAEKMVMLNFANVKDGEKILQKITEKADSEMRTVENMIMYLLRGII